MLYLLLSILSTRPAVVIVDNVWFYGNNHKTKILNTGDTVKVIKKSGDFIKVEFNNATGQLSPGVLIDLKGPIGEEELLIFARGYFDEADYPKAVRLFNLFINHFPKSNYLDMALYYAGLAYIRWAEKLKETDTIPGLKFNPRTKRWYYPGDAFMRLITEFPESPYTPKAEYQLIKLYRQISQPWSDFLLPIQHELRMWQNFIKKYPDAEEYILALMELGYLNRVLFEITGKNTYRSSAIQIFNEVMRLSSGSIYEVQARINLYEIEHNRNIYKY